MLFYYNCSVYKLNINVLFNLKKFYGYRMNVVCYNLFYLK